MLPLILLALGVGGALIAYEFSPRTRARVDDYARAIREAHAAHVAADAYLGNADRATAIASHHAQEMIAAQQEALAVSPPAPVPAPTRTAPPPAPAPPPPAAPQAPVLVQPVPPPAPVPAPSAPAPMPPTPAPVSPPAPAPVSPPTPPPAQGRAADHADAAQTAIDAAADHVAIATEQNQVAAQNTADAARAAKTEAERKAAADSAAKVLEREKKIAATLASLGIGQCGVRSFTRVTPQIKNTLLSKLHAEGMAVTGDNPWNIDTQQYDVKLRAVWDPKSQVLKLIVTAGKGGYFGLVTCDEIWKKIDPIMKGVIG